MTAPAPGPPSARIFAAMTRPRPVNCTEAPGRRRTAGDLRSLPASAGPFYGAQFHGGLIKYSSGRPLACVRGPCRARQSIPTTVRHRHRAFTPNCCVRSAPRAAHCSSLQVRATGRTLQFAVPSVVRPLRPRALSCPAALSPAAGPAAGRCPCGSVLIRVREDGCCGRGEARRRHPSRNAAARAWTA